VLPEDQPDAFFAGYGLVEGVGDGVGERPAGGQGWLIRQPDGGPGRIVVVENREGVAGGEDNGVGWFCLAIEEADDAAPVVAHLHPVLVDGGKGEDRGGQQKPQRGGKPGRRCQGLEIERFERARSRMKPGNCSLGDQKEKGRRGDHQVTWVELGPVVRDEIKQKDRDEQVESQKEKRAAGRYWVLVMRDGGFRIGDC